MSLTWLHISDFHIRSGDPYDRDVVLHALVQSVAEYRKKGRSPDLIFATGDIAYSGKPQEYELAGTFFNDLLRATGLDKSRLFVIPGNHDVDRDFGVGLARTLDSREQADAYFRPDRPKPHLTLKMRAFLEWHNERAVAETGKGDLHGRMDYASLSGTLSLGAACLKQLGEVDRASEWEQRAAEAKRKVRATSGGELSA